MGNKTRGTIDLKTAALLTVNHLQDMTELGKKDVVSWLRKTAEVIEYSRGPFAAKTRFRFWYREITGGKR